MACHTLNLDVVENTVLMMASCQVLGMHDSQLRKHIGHIQRPAGGSSLISKADTRSAALPPVLTIVVDKPSAVGLDPDTEGVLKTSSGLSVDSAALESTAN